MSLKKRHWYEMSSATAIMVVVGVVYAGLYGSMVDRFKPTRIRGHLVCTPEYSSSVSYALPESVLQVSFRPAHEIDKLLRPDYWFHAPQTRSDGDP